MPRALILPPQRRSMVSSMPITTSPLGNSTARRWSNNRRATSRASQRALLSTSWYRPKPGLFANPMTRSAWVTVRLPGARTAPPTSTRIWFQTGAVKQGRKTASQDSRIGGTVGWSVTDSMRFCVIGSVESSRPRRARGVRDIGRRRAPRHQIVASPNVDRNGRSDHSTYRVLPLLQGDLARGTSQPRLYALQCPVRRVGRTFASDRTGRQVRSALLVALEGPMGLDRPVRTHRLVDR